MEFHNIIIRGIRRSALVHMPGVEPRHKHGRLVCCRYTTCAFDCFMLGRRSALLLPETFGPVQARKQAMWEQVWKKSYNLK